MPVTPGGDRRPAAVVMMLAAFSVALLVPALGCDSAVELYGAQHTDSVAFRYGRAPADPCEQPDAVRVPLPDFPGNDAIWGATGRDDRGHIWIGVTARSGDAAGNITG